MFVKVGLQSKGFIATFAVKVFESRMGLHVSTKIGPEVKITLIHNPGYFFRFPPVSKRFATMSTTIGFVPGV